MTTYESLLREVKENLTEVAQDLVRLNEDMPRDIGIEINQCVDSAIPCYTTPRLEAAARLTHYVPEYGSSHNLSSMAYNVLYENLSAEAWQFWGQELEPELQENLDDLKDLLDEFEDIAEDPGRGAGEASTAWEESGVPGYLEKVVWDAWLGIFGEES